MPPDAVGAAGSALWKSWLRLLRHTTRNNSRPTPKAIAAITRLRRGRWKVMFLPEVEREADMGHTVWITAILPRPG